MQDSKTFHLSRRGFDLGTINSDSCTQPPRSSTDNPGAAWRQGRPILLRAIASDRELEQHAGHIKGSALLCDQILSGVSAEKVFDQAEYQARWSAQFEALGSSVNPAAQQEIETLFFDGLSETQELIEDLWVKISWLSFYEGDNSLRFRFSFGVDHEEDVAADPIRQNYSAALAQALFPESQLITDNQILLMEIQKALGGESPRFVERIVYFNAPNGGAYLHHDLERGHAGVIYIQASGQTCWLALSKSELTQVIARFVETCEHTKTWPDTVSLSQQTQLVALARKNSLLDEALESFNHDALIHLINETEAFVQYLIANGYAYILNTGDGILLPQQTQFDQAALGSDEPQNCCWHSVFCIGDEHGEGLSFAINLA